MANSPNRMGWRQVLVMFLLVAIGYQLHRFVSLVFSTTPPAQAQSNGFPSTHITPPTPGIPVVNLPGADIAGGSSPAVAAPVDPSSLSAGQRQTQARTNTQPQQQVTKAQPRSQSQSQPQSQPQFQAQAQAQPPPLSSVQSRPSLHVANQTAGAVAYSKASSAESLVTMFTTLIPTETGSQKYYIQVNTIKALQYLPGVQVVVFSKDAKVKAQVEGLGIGVEVVSDYRENKFGAPILKTMFAHVMHHLSSPFFGYTNGDILFCDELIKTLQGVKRAIQEKKMHDKVLVVGQRFNVDVGSGLTPGHPHVIAGPETAHAVVDRLAPRAQVFQTDAEDYFIVTPQAFDWPNIPAFVVGRVAYDNWLVDYAVHHDIETVDATKTIHAIHQTGNDGNMAGHTKKDGWLWNHPLGNHHYDHGKTTNCRFMTSLGRAGEVSFKERYAYGKYRASEQEKRNWNKVNCNDHPTWRLCRGETE